MKIGKLTNEQLNDMIIKHLKSNRSDILVSAGVGEDCAAIAFGDEACVLSTDPITGTDENLGRLAVHICCNDIASSGAEAVALMLTILCPVQMSDEGIESIIKEAYEEAAKLNVDIIGGHTERTSAVNRAIVSGTVIGRVKKEKFIKTAGAKAGDYIYMTKWAGLEGTGIIVSEKQEELKEILNASERSEAMNYLSYLSVIPEGKIAAEIGVNAMHDVTEGGILGAVHEMCEASGIGCEIFNNQIPIKDITDKICTHYILNPLRLISSGVMLIALSPDKAGLLEKAFLEADISYAKIGEMIEDKTCTLIYGNNEFEEIREEILPPESDELYKVLG